MSKFSEVTLSTGQSLTKHENEIIGLATITKPKGMIAITSDIGTLTETTDFDIFSVGDIINLSDNTEILVMSKTAPSTVGFQNVDDYAEGSFEVLSWSAKIEIAKEEIQREIEIILNRKYDQNNYDEDLINLINNAESFGLTSDYLTISNIFQDLMISSDSSDIYMKKSEIYYSRYKNSLNQNLEMIDIDSNFDGDTNIENVKFYQNGRILR